MNFIKRWQGKALKSALETWRVIILVGGRQVGKTTLAKEISGQDSTYRTLDETFQLNLANADPSAFLRHEKPLMVIDEIQLAPKLISAIKVIVDGNDRPGQFLLTGSTDLWKIASAIDSLAGRACYLALSPLAGGEKLGHSPQFLRSLLRREFPQPAKKMGLVDTVEFAIGGGFPEAQRLPKSERGKWYRQYAQILLERDLKEIADIRHQMQMKTLLSALAARSSKLSNFSEIASQLGVSVATVRKYVDLLQALFLVHEVPAWTLTEYGRLGKTQKLFMADVGLMAALLHWDLESILKNPEHVGKFVETLVFAELHAQIDASDGEWEIFHFRRKNEREIDFLLEHQSGLLVGIEVKASEKISGKGDSANLAWFEKNIAKERPFLGIVLHTGPLAYSISENIKAVPLQLLWDGPSNDSSIPLPVI